MPDVTLHPSPKALALFGNGKLSAAQTASVMTHLQQCPRCRDAVASLRPDAEPGQARGTGPHTSVPPTAKRTRLSRNSVDPDPASDHAGAVPPELAGHAKFNILRELGRGGMGVVYLAEHRRMDRAVALKVINPAVLSNPEAVARFLAEARTAGKLDHPNIARALDADQAGKLHFLVLEYVEGVSLAQLVDDKGPLSVSLACNYVSQAALALQHAYVKGMVHRDVKPQNLMVTPTGRVKVLDFGLARLRSEKAEAGLTNSGAFMGTAEYVAPEQATDAREADIRADIYSLGCTLFALLTGQTPFVEDTAVKLVLAHLEKEPPLLHEVRAGVPKALSAIVARMLAKDPDQRYREPREVVAALAPFLKAGAGKTALGRTGAATVSPAGKPPKTRAGSSQTAPVRAVEKRAAKSSTGPATTVPDSGAAAHRRRIFLGTFSIVAALAAVAGTLVFLYLRNANEPVDSASGTYVEHTPENPALRGETSAEAHAPVQPPVPVDLQPPQTGESGDNKEQQGGQASPSGSGGLTIARKPPDEQTKDVPASGTPGKSEGPTVGKGDANTGGSSSSPGDGGVLPSVPQAPFPEQVYQTFNSHWTLAGSELVHEPAFPGSELIFGDFNWTDYDYSLNFMLTSGNGELGLRYRINSAGQQQLALRFGPDTAIIATATGPNASKELSRRPAASPELNHWYTVRVSLHGDHCRCTLDGQLVGDYHHNRNLRGAVGLYVSRASVRIRDIRVTTSKVRIAGVPAHIATAEQWPPPSEPATADQLFCLIGHHAPVTGLAFTRDGQQVLSGSNGNEGVTEGGGRGRMEAGPGSTLRLWSLQTGKEVGCSSPAEPATMNWGFERLARMPSSTRFLTVRRQLGAQNQATSVQLWEVKDGKLLPRPVATNEVVGTDVTALGFSRVGQRPAAVGANGSVWEWDAKEMKPFHQAAGTLQSVASATITPMGTRALVSWTNNQPFAEIDLTSGRQKRTWLDSASNIHHMVYSPQGKHLVTGAADGTIQYWDETTARMKHRVGGHAAPVTALAISSDGHYALSGSTDQTVRLWDLDGARELACFRGHTGMITAVAFAPDGRSAASASCDYTVRIWRLPSPRNSEAP